jgi:hypothetical protein
MLATFMLIYYQGFYFNPYLVNALEDRINGECVIHIVDWEAIFVDKKCNEVAKDIAELVRKGKS